MAFGFGTAAKQIIIIMDGRLRYPGVRGNIDYSFVTVSSSTSQIMMIGTTNY